MKRTKASLSVPEEVRDQDQQDVRSLGWFRESLGEVVENQHFRK
jgi:hypothetical protein